MSTKPTVIVYTKLEPFLMDEIRDNCEVIELNSKAPDFRDQMNEALAHADGIIGAGLKVSHDRLELAPKLRVISNITVGYDNLDIPAITQRGIMATNTPDVLTETTADLMFGLLMATARRLPELDRYVKEGKWTSSIATDLYGLDVYGKTIGIIGMGRIGQAIARRGKFGFNMPIVYHNRSHSVDAEQELDACYCSLDELLSRSDFVMLMTPLTPETANLMGDREFALMKKSAIFINGSRGKTVDEDALVRALEEGVIASAGLDVYVKEPLPQDHPLLQMNKVVTLPHIGSATIATRTEMQRLAVRNLLCAVQGVRPPSLINPEVLVDKA
ncbi:D-glycerate dehydrogenase [Paenibacillus sp. N1-5-1-14]|uniref:2-hydroxyacid dehydrogenase n=1 Tax=Paenibacillus radicibacter TaxID=2972488 RepID=UPI0021591CD2|nr:D-glycerate dehydrogenase [Paenibacillus radicibacter]MCR8643106.1 D-glycerate dehydrogenase [Paenibacillus radicibacter]